MGEGGKIFCQRVASLIFPEGFTECDGDLPDEQVMIRIGTGPKLSGPRWYDDCKVGAPLMIIAYEWKNGKFGKWTKNGWTPCDFTKGLYFTKGSGKPEHGQEFIPIFLWKFYGPLYKGQQQLAILWQDTYKGIIVSFDVAGWPKGSKGFMCLPNWFTFRDRVFYPTSKERKNFYEFFRLLNFVRFYLDFDWKNFKGEIDVRKLLDDLFASIEESFNEFFPNASIKLTRRNIHVWSSCANGVISFHLFSTSDFPFVWKNCMALKTFVRHIKAKFMKRAFGRDTWSESEMIDLSPYKTTQHFRLVYCSKCEKPNSLTYYPHDGLEEPKELHFEDLIAQCPTPLSENYILDFLDPAPVPVGKKSKESGSSSALISLSEEQQKALTEAMQNIFNTKEFRITKVKLFADKFLCVETNIRDCLWMRRKHKSNTQRLFLFPDHITRTCWDPDCRNQKVRYPFPNARVFFPESNQDLRDLAVAAFPNDLDIWEQSYGVWTKPNDNFGPKGSSGIKYQIFRPFSLLRKEQTDECEYSVASIQYHCPKNVKMDLTKAKTMLDECNNWVKTKYPNVIPLGCLNVEKDRIYYYSTEGYKFSIRYNVKPAKTSLRDRLPQPFSDACFEFLSTVSLLPVSVKGDVDRVRKEWSSKGFHNIFFDHSDGDLNLSCLPKEPSKITLLIAPPGSGKTTAVRKSGFKGDICTSAIVLAEALNETFGNTFYIEDDGKTYRSQQALAEIEDQPITYVINSIGKAAGRHVPELFLDEITAQLTATASSLMKTQGPLVLSTLEEMIFKVPKVIMASADITPQLEGEFLKKYADKTNILYKARYRSQSNTRCIETMSDHEFLEAFALILLYNASAEKPLRIFFGSNTKAMVVRAEHIFKRLWPQGRGAFIHSESEIPDGFAKDPNRVWKSYDCVCISPKCKVGISFTEQNYFDVSFLYACSMTTFSFDTLQIKERVRSSIPLLILRIRISGGSPGETHGDEADTIERLQEFAEERKIDRSHLPKYQTTPSYEALFVRVQNERRTDMLEYQSRIRNALRKREITIELGGLKNNLLLTLGPLPAGTNLSGPNQKEDFIQLILEVEPLTKQEIRSMLKPKTALSLEQKAQLERYKLEKVFREHGGLTFENFVRLCIEDKFLDKFFRASVLLNPIDHAAAWDEMELSFRPPQERSHHLKQREDWIQTLSLMPNFSLDFLKSPETLSQYILERSLLEGDDEQIKKTISRIQSVLKNLALPKLVPKEKRGAKFAKPGKKTGSLTTYWTFEDIPKLETTLYYIDIMYWQIEEPIDLIIENPIFTVSDGITWVNHQFKLFQFGPSVKAIYIQINTTGYFETIIHYIRTLSGSNQFVREWALFRKDQMCRILYDEDQIDLKRFIHEICGYFKLSCSQPLVPLYNPYSPSPTHCLRPKILLQKSPIEGFYHIAKDLSEYFWEK